MAVMAKECERGRKGSVQVREGRGPSEREVAVVDQVKLQNYRRALPIFPRPPFSGTQPGDLSDEVGWGFPSGIHCDGNSNVTIERGTDIKPVVVDDDTYCNHATRPTHYL